MQTMPEDCYRTLCDECAEPESLTQLSIDGDVDIKDIATASTQALLSHPLKSPTQGKEHNKEVMDVMVQALTLSEQHTAALVKAPEEVLNARAK